MPALAAIATASETLLAIGLILGIAAKLTARAAAVVLIAFAAAMWTWWVSTKCVPTASLS
ncbi:hypothetical protein OIE68_33250 [Nocardia vinacea]|uniref:DoxX family protein n=1 Tax=Nocardia vinacea TaxID=96468 RepID=A0ABZ1Z3T4_9NOCA|nr:hypothetical protein OIE68_33250 [Nocardia vinacea]